MHLCGSVPNCEPWSPFACVCADGLCSSSIWPWKAALQPRLHAHSLTQAATPSYMHTTYTHAQIPHTPSHPRNTEPSHPGSSPPVPCTFTYVYPLHVPTLKNQAVTHLPHIHASTHTYPRTPHTLDPVTPMRLPHALGLLLTHTVTDTLHALHLCPWVHAVRAHWPQQLSALSHRATHHPIHLCPGPALQLPRRAPTAWGPLAPSHASWVRVRGYANPTPTAPWEP